MALSYANGSLLGNPLRGFRDRNRFLVTEILSGRFPRGRVDNGDAGQGGLDVPCAWL